VHEYEYREIRGSDFDSVREAANVAADYVVEMEKILEDLTNANLPKCIIHGDLVSGGSGSKGVVVVLMEVKHSFVKV